MHPGRCANLSLGDTVIGHLGEIHPDVLENYDIDERVYIAELDMDLILSSASQVVKFQPLPRYPASHRDLALVLEERVSAGDIIETIRKTGGALLEEVELFDIYRGGQIPIGFKSIAFALTYRSDSATLTDLQVNDLHQRIKADLVEKYDATLRE